MTKQRLKEIENRFYILQKQYYSLKDNKDEQKKVWDQMFFILHNAILAAIKKCLIGVKRNDVEDLAMDATIQVMNRYKKHAYYEIRYLLASARFAAIGILYNKKQMFYDSITSLEDWNRIQLEKEEESTNNYREEENTENE